MLKRIRNLLSPHLAALKAQNPSTLRLTPLKITGTYIVVGTLWILGSDFLLAALSPDRTTLFHSQIFKGWAYVVVTAYFLHHLIRRYAVAVNQSYQALQDSEARYRELFAHHPAPMWVYDQETLAFLAVNEAAICHYGYSQAEFLAMTILDILPDEEIPGLREILAHYPSMLHSSCSVWQHRKRDGSVIQVEVTSHALQFAGRPARGVLAHDVTERKRMEVALRQSEEQFRQVAENVEAVFWMYVVDHPQEILYISPAYEEIWGRSCESLYHNSRSWLEAVHPEDYDRINLALAQKDIGAFNEEYRILRPDGSMRWVRDRAFPVTNADGQIYRVVGIAQDITESKQAEVVLQESREQLEQLLDREQIARIAAQTSQQQLSLVLERIIDAFVALDNDWHYTYVNQKAGQLFNRDPADLMGKHIWTEFPEGVGQPFYHAYYRAMAEQAPIHIEDYYEPWDRWFENRIYPSTEGLAIFFHDITDRKRAEASVRESEARLRTLIENLPFGFWARDRNGVCVMQNAVDMQMWGNILGHSLEDAELPEATLAQWRDNQRRLLAGEKIQYEVKHQIDGEERTYVAILAPIWNQDVFDGWLGVNIDITEQKQTEAALAENQAHLLRAQELGCIGSWSQDLVTGTLQWSSQVDRIFGLAEAEASLTYEKFLALVHSDDRDWVNQHIQDAIAGKVEHDLTYRIVRPDGSIRWVHERAEIICNALGTPARLTGTAQDITERKQADLEIRQLNETLEQRVLQRTAQLEAANRELDSFSYSVSHDLRAPLRHISGFVTVLTQQLEEEGVLGKHKIAHYLDVIQQSSQKMGQLIDGLLTLSRVGRREVVQRPVQLRQLVDTAIALVETQRPKDANPIEFKIGELPMVMGDATMLQQVFTNLIDNAVKFSRDRNPAQIEIATLPDGTLFVKDNGAGFSMEYADQLFGAFQRLHSQRDFEGTGIGLAIVQRIIHRHGGRIWAESQPQQGATFYFQLGIVDTTSALGPCDLG